MACLVGVGMVSALLAPIVDREAGGVPAAGSGRAKERFHFGRAVVEPLADLFARHGGVLVAILVLVSLYRLPDFVAGVMANPLYIDLGFTKTEIANVSKLYGVWIGIIGAFAGGLVLPKIGLRNTLLIGAIAGAGSNLMFSWLALVDKPDAALTLFGQSFDLSFLAMPERKLALLTLAISIDNFSGSFAGTALIAYMSGLTAAGFAATQYALLSSLYALPGKLVGGVSGFMVESFGYPVFFALTALVGIPVVLLCLAINPKPPEASEAEQADAHGDAPGEPVPAR
jgi:PAT family beta-lactamase induction signal transducer AmpG